jgi:hypothetical protein
MSKNNLNNFIKPMSNDYYWFCTYLKICAILKSDLVFR